MNGKVEKSTLAVLMIAALVIPVMAIIAFPVSTGFPRRVEAGDADSTPTPIPAGNSDDDWTPVIEEFDGVEMVLVPAGCFMMGSDDQPFANEQPAHEVCLDAFWIDRFEVTNAQFEAFDGQAALMDVVWPGENRPRNTITWDEARDFCENRGARLPTEAEWEYAARGPEGWIYPWGDEFVPENVVYKENSGLETAEVGSMPGDASWVGALDMSGNVSEWVTDLYGFAYYSTLEDGVLNPTGPEEGTRRVHKGGSCEDDRAHASFRGGDEPDFSWTTLGFRCARSE
jgi:formylglycine-generating enzyme required for sulfatase activity